MADLIKANGLVLPDYLNVDFFKKCLENGLNSDVDVKSISVKAGSSNGENYCSIIYKVHVKFDTIYKNARKAKEASLIVKSMPMQDSLEMLDDMKVYEKELNIYLNVVPKIESLLKGDTFVAPKCYYSCAAPIKTIVFDDLEYFGYTLAERENGLDKAHAEILIKKIAKYHAASMVMVENNPDIVEDLKDSVFLKDDSQMKQSIMQDNIPHIAGMVENLTGFNEIAKKLRDIKTNFRTKSFNCLHGTIEPSFKVINHGDLWVNNFLFKYKKDVPINVAFIDFQISYYGSPGVDLNYFLNTSLQLEVLQKHRYDLLRMYYETFVTTLKQLNFKKIPSWEQVKDEIKATEFYGFFAFEAIFPIINLAKDASKDSSLETFSDSDAAHKRRLEMFKGERVKKMIEYSLMRFDELGVLD